jgi:phthiocerol/phenolphthiocerol synthesis type-I polyketide synthase E
MSETYLEDAPSGIAVIGMAGRFPGARDLSEFWQNLQGGVESITFFTDEELRAAGISPALLARADYVKARGIVRDADMFDAAFFGFNPAEAAVLDPQQRLFMECAWAALEDAAYDPAAYTGLVGVFAGASMSTYLLNLYANPAVPVGPFTVSIANDKDHLPTRTSYKLNLKGPSVAVQTACSTSLVAVHLACQSLLSYQCDMALAGGSSISVPQQAGYLFVEGGIDSPDGHCKAFDARANGTVSGSGVGLVVLKRMADALGDGDFIHAVILGSAINNDGSLKVGYTAPSVEGQAAVITMAQSVAEVEPETISYVETHGTGTFLGDPIEISALTQAFREGTKNTQFCAIGSVKSNIGHADAAAGVAGLIKTVLALKHKQIPPSLHFDQPNPQIDFASSPFYVNTKLAAWQPDSGRRRAGVSSFGIGGTNAHVVVEEAPANETAESARPAHLLLLSAKTVSALDAASVKLATHLRQHEQVKLADVAYTLQVGRRAFEQRRMLVARSAAEAAAALEEHDPRRVFTSTPTAQERSIVFMFPGQGAQYVNMGLELYQTERVFRSEVDECAELLRPQLGLDLRELLYPAAAQAEDAAAQLAQTQFTQPALFVIEYALAQLWQHWGVRPQAMIGHSIGEYVAACLSGVVTRADALALVAARGRMMSRLPPGAMLAVECAEPDVRPLLDKKLALAVVNSPRRCVIAGGTAEVNELHARLQAQGINCQPLHTSHAFHSAMMEPILEPFLEFMRRVRLEPPQIPYISNLTGTWATAAEVTERGYWARHLRQTVRFADGMQTLLAKPDSIFLEVGPGRTLTSLLAHYPGKSAEQIALASLRHPHEQTSDVGFILNTLGQLWLTGVRPDWSSFHAAESRRRLPLPTYPFERKRFWIDAPNRAAEAEPDRLTDAQPAPSHGHESAALAASNQTAQSSRRARRSNPRQSLERIAAQQLQVLEEQLNQQRRLLHEQLELLRASRQRPAAR